MSTVTRQSSIRTEDLTDSSDLWLVPRTGRVVIDERGNSIWQWPTSDDPFAQHDRLKEMKAADLRVVEPGEIRRSRLPWVHESERPAKEYPSAAGVATPRFR
jgi:hypothetical protein